MKNINEIVSKLLIDSSDNSEIVYDQQSKNFKSQKKIFSKKENITDFFCEEKNSDHVTSKQKNFYEDVMFPNYDGLETYGDLLDKSNKQSHLAAILDRNIKHSSSILEVGCGTGGNLSMLKDYGNLSAMEPDENARKLANSRNICLVKEGTLPNNIPFDETFDLVCMLGVLEHIDDDFGTLKSVKSKLKESFPTDQIL